jgi:NADPH-dependent 2,4-dienoyl-CoA reductase/sulfur reductase-like enzyme
VRLLVIGGSDAGISAVLAAREHDPTTDVTLLVADSYPNFSIPYHVSGDVPDWRHLAHRTTDDLCPSALDAGVEWHRQHADQPGHRGGEGCI